MYIGNEQLRMGGGGIALTLNDFWRWAGSDLTDNDTRSMFAEFLVASSLEVLDDGRRASRDYDLLWPQPGGAGIRVNVRSAAFVQARDAEQPDHITFNIGRPDRCDAYVFCLYQAMQPGQSPLETDLWAFYTLRSGALGSIRQGLQIATLPAIMSLGAVWSDYYGICGAIQRAMTAR